MEFINKSRMSETAPSFEISEIHVVSCVNWWK